jgi:tRNA dimethylallyltransferase
VPAAGAGSLQDGLDVIDQRPPAVFLMGPTASGKTELALALAERFPVTVISVDSALVYRGLDVGSAKPDAAIRAQVPHELIDIRDPAESYSAAEFRDDALGLMQRAARAGRIPLLVGGTGLYFRVLQHGLSALPGADPELRARLAEEGERLGWQTLHARLARLDPEAARRIRPADRQRVQRALEVIELTGRPLSAQQQGAIARPPFRILKLVVDPGPRARLHQRIRERLNAMLAAGLLEEVRALMARGDLHAGLPALRAVGYRQAWEHLSGRYDRDTFVLRALHATRQLAKRQLTWLRREFDARWLPASAVRHAEALAMHAGGGHGRSHSRAGNPGSAGQSSSPASARGPALGSIGADGSTAAGPGAASLQEHSG